MGCGCNGAKGNMEQNKSGWVEMAYTGNNSAGGGSFRGYMNRSYVAKRGDTILVHPEDVAKLKRIPNGSNPLFVTVDKEVETAVEPESQDDPVENVEIDATSGAIALAESVGLDIATITGTGKNGRILKSDVENYLND